MRRTNGLERDEGEAARRQKHRARTLKGWETRRGSERLSPVIDGADEEWLDGWSHLGISASISTWDVLVLTALREYTRERPSK
jgi:hypothetical protein